MIGSTTNALNATRFADGKSRTPYGGSGFAAINALVHQATASGELNSAKVESTQLLADLNHLGIAPQLSAAVAGINRAHRDNAVESDPQNTARREELTKQARTLVSQTFFGPMLKQMRDSPFKSELFEGGRGGQMFGSMLDQRLADHMSRGSGNKLVGSIVEHLEKLAGKRQAAMTQQDVKQTELPEKENPYANVRVHVAPNLGS